jgi:hypothetical protein
MAGNWKPTWRSLFKKNGGKRGAGPGAPDFKNGGKLATDLVLHGQHGLELKASTGRLTLQVRQEHLQLRVPAQPKENNVKQGKILLCKDANNALTVILQSNDLGRRAGGGT